LRIRRFFREREVGIVHTPLYSRVSPYVRLAARLASVPLVVAHEYGRPQEPSALRKLADRLLQGRTRFVAASRQHARELLAQGVAADDVEVVYSGIDTQRFAPRDKSLCRESWGLPRVRPLILVPARLHPMKGHGVLLDAVPDVIRQVPDVIVLCAGEGPSRDLLAMEVESRGLTDTVRLLGHRDDIPVLLGASDVVALPSLREGLPSAMLEAFAAGRPVVATAVGGVAEALEDGREGCLVPPNRPDLLAQALARLLEDPVRRREMGRKGVETAKRFTAEASTRELESLYMRWLS
jgi:glycosyltransferase involved in cell wall biosynthesis